MICNFMIFSESVGSGVSLSANKLKLSALRWAFFVQNRQELAPVRPYAI